ncbi:hypothetical protein [Lapillicoccus sp.]|uniref:hypothetical protein n=1 Tax=Lapillicoccus sp. TaxID=1909287 RepID=UPI0032668781
MVSLRLFTGALAICDRVDLGHGYAEKIAAAKVFGPSGAGCVRDVPRDGSGSSRAVPAAVGAGVDFRLEVELARAPVTPPSPQAAPAPPPLVTGRCPPPSRPRADEDPTDRTSYLKATTRRVGRTWAEG